MDHLPQPSHPTKPPLRIPYLVKEADQFDELDFTSFPERRGWDKEKLRRLTVDRSCREDVLSVLQSWLYFGTLRSVLGRLFDAATFVDKGQDGSEFLCTKHLPDLMRAWMRAWIPDDVDKLQQDEALQKAETALQEARRVRIILEEANSTLLSISLPRRNQSLITLEVILSIDVLLSSLSNASVIMFGLENSGSVGSATELDFKCLGYFEDWCPFILGRVSQKLNSSALYYAARMPYHNVPRLHTNCTERECSSERVDSATYVSVHDCADGRCKFEGPDVNEVYQILDNDDFPIVILSEEAGNITIKAVPAASNSSYIAISHVWAHGLGNPHHNKMPVCQLRRLQSFVHELQGDGDTALWVDTLCCPIEGRYCELAIAKMVPTYRNAAHVLVLDEGLLQASCKMPPTEILMHLCSSMWMQRLWTLQEGALSSKLRLRLRDGHVIYDQVLRAVGDRLEDTAYETVSRELLAACQTLRLVGIPEKPGINFDFGLWINILQFRKTSELPDESLCLATLLGHDLAKIVPLSHEERLKEIYSIQSHFPSNIFFLGHPKMSVDGYKWAPQSWLESGQGFGGTLISAPSYFTTRFIPGHGLIADLSSFEFEKKDRVTIPMMFQDPRTGFVYIVASGDGVDEHKYTPADLPYWTNRFSLLFETRRDNTDVSFAVAILTAISKQATPTEEVKRAVSDLGNPDEEVTYVHNFQRVVVALEPRFGRVAHTDDVCHVIQSTMALKRFCIM